MSTISGVSPPSQAVKGTIYYDQNNGNNYIWNGYLWETISPNMNTPYDYEVTLFDSKSMVQYVDELGEI